MVRGLRYVVALHYAPAMETMEIGPRTLERREAYRLRKALLDSGRTSNLTVLAVRRQTELNERDKAERLKGGPGNTRPLTKEERTARYRAQTGRPITERQARQIVRKNPAWRKIFGKGEATPKRPFMARVWLGVLGGSR